VFINTLFSKRFITIAHCSLSLVSACGVWLLSFGGKVGCFCCDEADLRTAAASAAGGAGGAGGAAVAAAGGVPPRGERKLTSGQKRRLRRVQARADALQAALDAAATAQAPPEQLPAEQREQYEREQKEKREKEEEERMMREEKREKTRERWKTKKAEKKERREELARAARGLRRCKSELYADSDDGVRFFHLCSAGFR
jgi:hypothetical protein